MAVMDKVRSIRERMPESKTDHEERTKLPDDIKKKLDRSRDRTRKESSTRDLCWELWRGNHFAYLSDKGALSFLSTGQAGIRAPGKPSWKSRLTTNLFRDHIEQQVALATQRVPSYDVVPSTTDPEDIGAAKLSKKVAFFGHEKWGMPRVAESAVRSAVVADEGFAWPFWDETVGPYADDGNGSSIGLGEVGIRTFGANQVGWEPGLQFEDSPFHYVEYAASPESILERDDYMGGELVPDASTDSYSKGLNKASNVHLVLVREYLERPCLKHPEGRWLTVANGRLIAGKEGDTYRPYPCAEYGYDGIVLHRLTYYDDSDSDRGQGLGRDLVDPMRIFRDCMNALVEWKDILLKPRIFMTPGALQRQRITGEPGQIIQISQPNDNIKVMDAPDAPQTLFELADRAADTMARIAAQADPPSGADSAKSFQVWDERQKVRAYPFYVQLATWYSGVMEHCLFLVQKHYSEDRLLKVRGSAGWESIDNFRGADLKNQMDVRVLPDSLEPLTRQKAEEKIMFYAQQQWISPERALEAIELGTADKLVEDLNNDRERANRIIQAIKQGPKKLFAMKGRVVGIEADQIPDPATGQLAPNPAAGKPIREPGWMPRPFDNLNIQKYIFETWMKSDEFENQISDEMRDAAWMVYEGLIQVEAQKQAQEALAQEQLAQSLGQANAAAPQGPSPTPDQPAVPGGNPGVTQNQPPGQSTPSSDSGAASRA